MRYEVLSHTADTGIIVHGPTLDEVFANAAYAMFDLMFDLDTLVPDTIIQVEVEAADVELLLVNWLSELLARFEIDGRVWCRFSVSVHEGWHAVADAEGAPPAELRGPPIKAVTYHGLQIRREETGWRAQVIFDV